MDRGVHSFGSGAIDIDINEKTDRIYMSNLNDGTHSSTSQSFLHEKDKEQHNQLPDFCCVLACPSNVEEMGHLNYSCSARGKVYS